MRIPTISDYHVEEVEIPAPKDEQQILREAMGVDPPSLPPGPPRKVIKITLDADDFSENLEIPFSIVVGSQTLTNISVWGGGKRISGVVSEMPREGDAIVMNFPTVEEEGTVLAGSFQMSKVERRLA